MNKGDLYTINGIPGYRYCWSRQRINGWDSYHYFASPDGFGGMQLNDLELTQFKVKPNHART
jgi:hypothetical protein